MNKPIDSQVIIDIVKKNRGIGKATTQYDIADEYIKLTHDHITARTVRNKIEILRFKKIPILSTPHDPGGYFWPATRKEYFDWKDRETIKAKKQIAKLRPVGFGVYRYFHKNVIQQVFDFGKRLAGVS